MKILRLIAALGLLSLSSLALADVNTGTGPTKPTANACCTGGS